MVLQNKNRNYERNQNPQREPARGHPLGEQNFPNWTTFDREQSGDLDGFPFSNSNPGSIKAVDRGDKVPGNRDQKSSDDDVENRWKAIEKEYRKHYPKITDQDVNYRPGQFEYMASRIAKRTNRGCHQIIDEIRFWKS